MKKLLTIATFLLLSFESYAKDGVYIGADINRSHVKYRIIVLTPNLDGGTTEFAENKTDKAAVAGGLNVGYNFDINDKFFVAPELFYDHLNNKVGDPYGNPDGDGFRQAAYYNDTTTLTYRYGAKVNLGYNFAQKFALFTSIGVANVNYKYDWNSNIGGALTDNHSYRSDKVAMIYGLGAAYKISDEMTGKISIDHQSFNTTYALYGWRSKVNLNVVKLGVAYNF